jgi:hypothetical protein
MKGIVQLRFRSQEVVALLVTWDTVISITNRAGICLPSSLSNVMGVQGRRGTKMMDSGILHDLEGELAHDRQAQLLAAAVEARWLASSTNVSHEMREQLLMLAWDSVREAGPQ